MASTSLLSALAVSCMKAPVAFCWATVARTQGSLTSTEDWAHALADRAIKAVERMYFMKTPLVVVKKRNGNQAAGSASRACTTAV